MIENHLAGESIRLMGVEGSRVLVVAQQAARHATHRCQAVLIALQLRLGRLSLRGRRHTKNTPQRNGHHAQGKPAPPGRGYTWKLIQGLVARAK